MESLKERMKQEADEQVISFLKNSIPKGLIFSPPIQFFKKME